MIWAIVMAGGIGTRFWPLSRKEKAKQFLDVLDTGKSLLELTVERIRPLVGEAFWIVGAENQRQSLLPIHENCGGHVLYEPMGRNTAACIGWAVARILKQDPEAIAVVLPADHYIPDGAAFLKTIKAGIKIASSRNCLVTLGVVPATPQTGYGYIQAPGPQDADGSYDVKAFVEKPDFKTAVRYLASGEFFWNSGIFILPAQLLIDLYTQHLPTHAATVLRLAAHPDDPTLLRTEYEKIPSISIDYGLLEKAHGQLRMIPANFIWSDIGSWGSVGDFWPSDANGNQSVCRSIHTINATNNRVFAPGKVVGLLEVQDLIVVDSDDAILIAKSSADQQLKALYDLLPDDVK
jgi:mannose-1-phosphate guanylyltransferase